MLGHDEGGQQRVLGQSERDSRRHIPEQQGRESVGRRTITMITRRKRRWCVHIRKAEKDNMARI